MSSERLKLEAELRQLESRVAELRHQLGDGPSVTAASELDWAVGTPAGSETDALFVWDAQGLCQAVRTARSEVLGVATGSWHGAKVEDLLPEELASTILMNLKTAITGHAIQSIDLPCVTSTGQMEHYRAWLVPQETEDVLALLIDRSNDHRLSDRCEDLKQQIIDKNQELQQFTYRVSHDLKGPLVSIKGFSQLLREDLQDGVLDELQDHLGEVVEAAEKMQFLIDRILDLSRVGTASVELVSHDMADLIRGAMRGLADEIETSGARIHLAEPMPQAIGDQKQLTTVFHHLIDNACKYVRAGTQPEIEVGAKREVGRVLWYVNDKGVGLEPEHLTSVFEIFQRIDQSVPGAGVGLALSKRIIELHGGRIWVESPGQGKGTTVYFTLGQQDPSNSK
jgi:signal transduction histidine kinase